MKPMRLPRAEPGLGRLLAWLALVLVGCFALAALQNLAKPYPRLATMVGYATLSMAPGERCLWTSSAEARPEGRDGTGFGQPNHDARATRGKRLASSVPTLAAIFALDMRGSGMSSSSGPARVRPGWAARLAIDGPKAASPPSPIVER